MVMGKFVCDYEGCTKSFNRRDYLERHAANHMVVKPYICGPCNRSFARSDLYENHLLTKFHLKRAGGDNRVHKTTSSSSSSSNSSSNSPSNVCAISNILSPPSSKPASPIGSPPPKQKFYDSLFSDVSSCLNYHEIYSDYSNKCEINHNNSNKKDAPGLVAKSILIDNEQCQKINQLLSTNWSHMEISNYLDLAWYFSDGISNLFIHRPTFIANEAHVELLSTLTIIGAYFDNVPITTTVDKMIESTLSQSSLFALQTLALLLWFKLYILKQDLSETIDISTFYQSLLESSTSSSTHYHLDNAIINNSSWKKWIEYESSNRCTLFISLLLLNNNNIKKCVCMPCPDSLWKTKTADEFSVINGKDTTIPIIPYISTLQSLLRIPKLYEHERDERFCHSNYWSPFALSICLQGLNDISTSINKNDSGSKARLENGFKLWRNLYNNHDSSSCSSKFISQNILNGWPLIEFYQKSILLHEDISIIERISSQIDKHNNNNGIENIESYRRWAQSNEAKSLSELARQYLNLLTISGSNSYRSADRSVILHSILILWLTCNEPQQQHSSDLLISSCNLINLSPKVLSI